MKQKLYRLRPIMPKPGSAPKMFRATYDQSTKRPAVANDRAKTPQFGAGSSLFGSSLYLTQLDTRRMLSVMIPAILGVYFLAIACMRTYDLAMTRYIIPARQRSALVERGYSQSAVEQIMQTNDLRETYLNNPNVNHRLISGITNEPDFVFTDFDHYQLAAEYTGEDQTVVQFYYQVMLSPRYDQALASAYASEIADNDKINYDDGGAGEVIKYLALDLNDPVYGDDLQAPMQDTNLVMPDKRHSLPSDYAPGDITEVEEVNTGGDRLIELDQPAAQALDKMFAAARGSGIDMMVSSGYRSYSQQEQIHTQESQLNGESTTDSLIARPGRSEHQTGLAIDIVARGSQLCNFKIECFDRTAAYQWMTENAASYGYIQSYTQQNQVIVGYSPEPWHWRYVGEVASEVKAAGSLQEYVLWVLSVDE